ncbi:MAG: class I SAM-dependent methyltransferase [Planctomycetia bacterium]|nr:MAG: class I SAM-dependent methyltransferase [Planctomycetia bacterium]
MKTNQDVYTTVEFDQWAGREELLPEERFLISKYLATGGSTLEAGTGGGRIILACAAMGFQRLSAFDFVPGFVEAARRRDTAKAVDFRVGDARRLEYADGAFDQIIYLQQILSLLESAEDRQQALREAARIVRPGGVALFSFLGYEARLRGRSSAMMLRYLRLLRAISGAKRSPQTLPWLNLGGKWNYGALLDRGPYVYWYRIPEVHEFLSSAGFEITAAGVGHEVARGRIHESCAALAGSGAAGTIYVACRRR